MSLNHARRLAGLILPVALIAAAAPATANAATVTITDDAGNAVPLTSGMALRHMAPDVNIAFTGDEKYYAAKVVGPAGPASTGSDCSTFVAPERVKYQGNGTYTVVYKTGADRAACEAAAEQSIPFSINASTAISPPGGQLLTREPNAFGATQYAVPVALNPGADSYELKYALNATLGPDGGIVGETQSGFVGQDGKANVSFTKPGRYTFVVRAKTFRSDVPTAWSPRVDVNVLAPFDLSFVSLRDSIGPSYKLVGQVRETSIRGKIKVTIARGKNGKRFKRLGVAKLRSGGKFTLKFRQRRLGSYRLKFSYPGSATVVKGTAFGNLRLFRRFG